MHDEKVGAQFLNKRSRVRRPVKANVANVTVVSILLLVKVLRGSFFFCVLRSRVLNDLRGSA